MSIIKKLASETALYGVSTMAGRMLNYLLVALHTKLFGPGLLAAQSELYVWVAVVFVVYVLGMETGFFRFGSRSVEDKRVYYEVAMTAVVCSSLLLSGLVIVFASPLSALMGYEGESTIYVWMAIILATDAIVSIPFARLRLEKQSKKFVQTRLINIFLNVGLNLFFLVLCRHIYEGQYLRFLRPAVMWYDPAKAASYVVLANLIANLTFFWFLRKQFSQFWFNFDRKILKELWNYSYPILLMNLAAVTNMMADRIFLRALLPEGFYPGLTSKEAFGIYAQCYKLSIFMNLTIQAFKYAAEPFFFSQADNKNAPTTFALIMKWFIVVCVLIWVVVSLNVDLLAHLFLQQDVYHEGIVVVPFLLLAFLFLGIYYNLTAWFKLADKTHYGSYITLMGAVSTVVLNVVLVPILGYLGCAITFAISSFLMMAVCYFLGQKHYPIPYQVGSAAFYVISAGVLIAATYPLKNMTFWVSIIFHATLCLLYTLIVVVVERKSLPAPIRQKLKFLG